MGGSGEDHRAAGRSKALTAAMLGLAFCVLVWAALGWAVYELLT
jgi:hypothetical protein